MSKPPLRSLPSRAAQIRVQARSTGELKRQAPGNRPSATTPGGNLCHQRFLTPGHREPNRAPLDGTGQWLLIYGETFTRIHAIPTPKGIPYLAYLSPGILAQSALFIAIFYGIQIIWERDAGVLAKLMVTPTPRAALITGKAFAAGVRSLVQGIVVVVLSAVLQLERPVPDPGHARLGCRRSARSTR
jgi:ABC-type multidrug transport system permease subunit